MQKGLPTGRPFLWSAKNDVTFKIQQLTKHGKIIRASAGS